MPYFEITDLDWNLFEEKYNIQKTEIIEVDNVFRHMCRLFVLKSDLNLWNEKPTCNKLDNLKNVKVNFYRITNEKKWTNSTMEY